MSENKANKSNQKIQWAHKILGLGKGENILLRVAAILMILVLVTSYLLCGLLARYVSTSSGSDKARVASFGQITLSETPVAVRLFAPGVDVEKDPKVSFGTDSTTETAAWVFVELTLSNNWTFDSANNEFYLELLREDENSLCAMTFAVAQGWTYLETENYGDTGTTSYIFYMWVATGESLNEMSVLADDKILVSDRIYYDEMEDLEKKIGTLDVTAYAIQANENDNASDAWSSIN